MLLHQLYSKLPPGTRAAAKQILRSSGHSRSVLDPLSARKDALGKKRLDRSLSQVIEVLGNRGVQLLPGRKCVDFGAGYTPMDAISMWLLGASSVVAIDYNNIVSWRALRLGLAKADFNAVRRMLSDRAPDFNWSDRLDSLIRISSSRKPEFEEIPLRYIAPLDVIATPDGLPEFDFLWSVSVLEHIAPSRLIPLLVALRDRGAPGAVHVHRVDLRDHRDFDGAPYGFLQPDADFDPEAEADVRGNAMTLDTWEKLLADHPELDLRVAAFVHGTPNLVPRHPVTKQPVISRVADYITIASEELDV